jgi:hypothetical protein
MTQSVQRQPGGQKTQDSPAVAVRRSRRALPGATGRCHGERVWCLGKGPKGGVTEREVGHGAVGAQVAAGQYAFV